jgi:hypothetical protein
VPGAAALLVAHRHPGDPAILDEDLLDGVVHEAGAAARLDDLLRPVGDRPRGAGWVPAAVEVVPHDEGVHREGAARRRQPVVAPLRREDGAQARVAEVPFEVVLGGRQGETTLAQPGHAHTGAEHTGGGPAVGLTSVPVRGPADVGEVALNALDLVRECAGEGSGVLTRVARHLERQVRVVEHLEHVRHLLPLHPAAGDQVEEATTTQIVDPDVPVETPALEGVREAAELEVGLQHQHPLALEPREECRCRQPSDARTDDDDVVLLRLVHGALRSAAVQCSQSNEGVPGGACRREQSPTRRRPELSAMTAKALGSPFGVDEARVLGGHDPWPMECATAGRGPGSLARTVEQRLRR